MNFYIGPDVPSRSNLTSRNVRHYLVGNLTASSQNSSVLATASLLSNSSVATNEYDAPALSAGTGSHRYVYLLYTQPAALNSKLFASLEFNASDRTVFDVSISNLRACDVNFKICASGIVFIAHGIPLPCRPRSIHWRHFFRNRYRCQLYKR
ncbi:hypothetical protein DL98DRAFT_517264 [Cadophora sp. DSE1049]|nr:hypothetical protein DL98DRAFT_517264 [Cadophora sp. DSE1049]